MIHVLKCMLISLSPSTLARFLPLFSKWQRWSLLWVPSARRRTYSFYHPYHVFWTNILAFSPLNLSAHHQITSYFLWMMLQCSQSYFLKSTTFPLIPGSITELQLCDQQTREIHPLYICFYHPCFLGRKLANKSRYRRVLWRFAHQWLNIL